MIEQLQTLAIRYKRSAALHWQKASSKIETALLFGNYSNSYYCPCCNKHCNRFIDWSSTYRNVVCPYCDSQPRHRALALYLDKYTRLNGERIKFLHFAPTPIFRKQFSSMPNLDYTTADLYDSSVDVKIDITQIPYPDNTFDVIFCNHVLEHVMDDRKAMREMLRVLKPGGWASLQVPLSSRIEKTFEDPTITSPKDRLKYFLQEDHVRLYGLDYQERLKEEGFLVKVENLKVDFNPEQIQKYGLGTEKKLYFGIKPAN
jgi:SAM-dependent methyltransferase